MGKLRTTEKQIAANRVNALKSTGPSTAAGKTIASRNSIRHGLLAREIVIDNGEGAEDRQSFDALLTDLTRQFAPRGPIEEMLVEKIAVAYWRLRRAHRYETGLIREKLDRATLDFYESENPLSGSKINRPDHSIDFDIQLQTDEIREWDDVRARLTSLHQKGVDLSETFDIVILWDSLVSHVYEEIAHIISGDESPPAVREALKELGWPDEAVWKALFGTCDREKANIGKKIDSLHREKERNVLALEVERKLAGLPAGHGLDRLLKYETTIEKQFYKALSELERIQRLRGGEPVPPPLKLEVDVTPPESV